MAKPITSRVHQFGAEFGYAFPEWVKKLGRLDVRGRLVRETNDFRLSWPHGRRRHGLPMTVAAGDDMGGSWSRRWPVRTPHT